MIKTFFRKKFLFNYLMKSFSQKYLVNAPINKVWQALVDPKVIEDWGGGAAKMSAEEGAFFSLWGGDIWGKNKKVIDGKLLVQDWYGGKWEKPSKVSFILSQKGQKTEVILKHENLPDDGWKDFFDGWRDYYMGPLKKLLENG